MNQSKILISIILLFVIGKAISQSTDQNFVLSHTYKQKGASINLQNVKTTIQYLDGLGRPMQTINMGIAPNGNDAIEPIVYDEFGRQKLTHLQYSASTSSNFQSSATTSQANFYSTNSLNFQGSDNARPFTEDLLEDSPLNRELGIRQPGNNSNSSSISYERNGANEVKRYDSPLTENGHYAAEDLYKITVIDENNKISKTYTDKDGNIVCKKIVDGTESLDTYFIYDDNNRLTTVLQPEYQTTASADYFAFQYNFDDKGRLIAKKNPGAAWEYMVYDTFDRLRFSQDGNQRSRNVWYFLKYDALNRVVYSGEISSPGTSSFLNIALTNNNAHHETRNASGLGYSLASSYPEVTANDIYIETFYDNYTGLSDAYNNVYSISKNDAVLGHVTGSRIKVLGTTTKLISVNYYDSEYRPIQIIRELYNLGDRKERKSIKYLYDLAAVIAEEKVEHYLVNTTSNIHTKKINYDHADRPLSIQETVSVAITNGQSLSETAYTQAYRYNQLGALTEKWTHSNDGINFRHRTDKYYNIRGWNTEGNSVYKQDGAEKRYFGYLLDYTTSSKYTNGNISSLYLAEKDEDGYNKGQTFAYDGANRLTASTAVAGFSGNESGITYDKNGNIKTLIRSGTLPGTFVYTYNGNQIKTVNSSTYGFDANGNTTTDANRALTIDYNYLNLVNNISGSGLNQSYVYDADGQKLQFTTGSVVTKYAGPFEYGASNIVSRVSITDGQAKVIAGITLRFEYYHKDHLNNTRAVFDDSGILLQRTDYYPFGLEVISSGSNKYNFLGRETQTGTGYVDLMARFYDPKVPHFLTQDPVIEGQEDQSLYQYGWNNPILRSDPNGDFPFILPALPIIAEALGVAATALVETAIGAATVAVVTKLAVKYGETAANGGFGSPAVNLAQSTSNIKERNDVRSNIVNSKEGKYGHLKEPRKVGPGEKTTSAQRKRILEENKKQNNGELKSDGDGRKLNPPKNTKKGEKADMDQAEVDHIDARSKGGSNSNKKLQVLSKEENIKKRDN